MKQLTYFDDIKIFAKNKNLKFKKKIETLIQMIRIYSQDVEMEFSIEKYEDIDKKKKIRTKQRKEKKYKIRKASEHLEEKENKLLGNTIN